MKMIIMGSGTSHGVPVIGCKCPVCKSTDKKNNRLRSSAFITDGADIVIDTGPEFRIQALRYEIDHLDCVLITHSHADHVYGMDDLRIFSHTKAVDPHSSPNNKETSGMPVYANTRAVDDIKYSFDYVFMPTKEGGGKPKFDLNNCDDYGPFNPIKVNNIEIIPVPLMHGSLPDSGYLLSQIAIDGKKHSIAYLTDCNYVSKESIELINDNCGILDYVVIDGLREKSHSTHFSFEEALQVCNQLNAKNVYLTHITHNKSHEEIQEYIDSVLDKYKNLCKIVAEGGVVQPAYDGLVLQI